MVEEAYSADSGSRGWNVSVIRNLNDWEIEECEALLLLLSQFQLDDCRDQLMWKLGETRGLFC